MTTRDAKKGFEEGITVGIKTAIAMARRGDLNVHPHEWEHGRWPFVTKMPWHRRLLFWLIRVLP